VIIPAGAAYGRRLVDNPRNINSYNYVSLNLSNGSGSVYLRRWNDDGDRWDKHTDAVPDTGRFDFVLPRSLNIKAQPKAADVKLELPKLEITVDTRPFLGDYGGVVSHSYEPDTTIQELLDGIRERLNARPAVYADEYGQHWYLRDTKTGLVFREIGRKWAKKEDKRSPSEVGLNPDMHLEVVPVESFDTPAELSVEPSLPKEKVNYVISAVLRAWSIKSMNVEPSGEWEWNATKNFVYEDLHVIEAAQASLNSYSWLTWEMDRFKVRAFDVITESDVTKRKQLLQQLEALFANLRDAIRAIPSWKQEYDDVIDTAIEKMSKGQS
jgi:hypothetical protein